jgi:hypothetical protein
MQSGCGLNHCKREVIALKIELLRVQVLLRPDGGGGVRLPARLLALYSCLFDNMFQDMLQQEEEDNAGSNAEPQVVSRTVRFCTFLGRRGVRCGEFGTLHNVG